MGGLGRPGGGPLAELLRRRQEAQQAAHDLEGLLQLCSRDVRGLKIGGMAIEKLRDKSACAINLEYVKMYSPLRDGDEVCFIPPVSGG